MSVLATCRSSAAATLITTMASKNKDPKSEGGDGKTPRDRENARYQSSNDVVRKPVKLNYSVSGPNNFAMFKKQLAAWAESKYGDLGGIVTTGEHQEIEEPDMPDASELTSAKDPHGIKKSLYLEDYKEYKRDVREYKKNYRAFSTEMFELLSLASQSIIKAQPEYDDFKESRDPLELWQMIVNTHEGSLTGTQAVDMALSSDAYHALTQGPRESCDMYLERIEQALDAMEKAGLDRPPDQLVASKYIKGLDDARFGVLKLTLVADDARGLTTRPTTLSKAHGMATVMLYAQPRVVSAGGAGARENSVFAAGTESQESGGKNKKGKSKANTSKKGSGCFYCGGDHYVVDCAKFIAAKERDGFGSEQSDQKPRGGGGGGGSDNKGKKGGGAPRGGRGDSVLMAWADFDDNDIILDNGATAHLFKNPKLLKNLRKSPKKVRVRGVGGSIESDVVGDCGPFTGIYLHSESPANVLSFSKLADEHNIAYDQQQNAFVVEVGEEDVAFTTTKQCW